MSTSLQSPVQYPAATYGGKLYTCRFSFGASRRVANEKLDERYPVVKVEENADAATKALAANINITRTLITAACTFGTETPEGSWIPMAAPKTSEGYIDWVAMQETMAMQEMTGMVAAINEAYRLADEMAKKAQTPSLTPTRQAVQ